MYIDDHDSWCINSKYDNILIRSLESDLLVMSNSPDPPTSDSINNTHTGHVIKSRGGMGIKILYFHNTALINSENKVKEKVKVKLESGTGSEVLEEESASVSIGVECSNTNQLPTQNLFIRNNEFKQLSLKVNSGKLTRCAVCNIT